VKLGRVKFGRRAKHHCLAIEYGDYQSAVIKLLVRCDIVQDRASSLQIALQWRRLRRTACIPSRASAGTADTPVAISSAFYIRIYCRLALIN